MFWTLLSSRTAGMGKEPRSLLEVCVARAGGGWSDVRRGARVAELIVEWAIAREELGRDFTVSEFSRWWRHTDREQRTAWRRLREFRELFPEYDTPDVIAAEIVAKGHGRGELTTVRVSVA